MEQIGQGPIGQFPLGSELALERKKARYHIITHRHRTVAVQSTERVPSRLQFRFLGATTVTRLTQRE